MIDFMTAESVSNNQKLRVLIEASGLSQAVAMTIFNRKLGAAAFSESAWKALFLDPQSDRFLPLSDAMLEHAQRQFSKS